MLLGSWGEARVYSWGVESLKKGAPPVQPQGVIIHVGYIPSGVAALRSLTVLPETPNLLTLGFPRVNFGGIQHGFVTRLTEGRRSCLVPA